MVSEIVKYTAIIIETLPDAFLVKCAYCNGKGEHPRRYEVCPACKGVGSIWVGSLKEY
jgi:hypothetical protein